MDKETKRKYESTFIPCGDALEKMELFVEDGLEELISSEPKTVTEKNADRSN